MNPTAAGIMTMLVLMLALASAVVWLDTFRRLIKRQPLIPFEPWRPAPWTGWDVLVLAVAWVVFQSMLIGMIAPRADTPLINAPAVVEGVQPPTEASRSENTQLVPTEMQPETQPTSHVQRIVAVALSQVTWIAFFLIYAYSRTGDLTGAIGLVPARFIDDVGLGLRLLLAVVLPVFSVQTVLTKVFQFESKHELIEANLEKGGWFVLVLSTVAAVILAPVLEELLFRRLLQGWLEKSQISSKSADLVSEPSPGYSPLVLSSLLFAGMHYTHGPDPVALFLLSLMMGYAYRQTHRIIAPITIHVCFNSLSMLQLWLMAIWPVAT